MKKKDKIIQNLLDLQGTAMSELKFSNLCQDHLKSIIYEIESISKDSTITLIIENGLERHNLDKCIHARKIFDNL